MSLTGWVLLLLVLIATAGVAWWLGRLSVSRSGRMQTLEQERDAANAELARYQQEVRDHFETTAALFNQVTGSYRQLYEHLADGAGRLASHGDGQLLQQSPEQRRLPEDLGPDAAEREEAASADSPDAEASPEALGAEPEALATAESEAAVPAQDPTAEQPPADAAGEGKAEPERASGQRREGS
jgi:uncharacterized protein